MNVVFRISGREAIPVRAIPYMAGTTVSADILVRGLLSVDPINPLHGLSAYELLNYDVCRKVSPWEWSRFAIELQALTDRLNRQERDGELTTAECTSKWKQNSVKLLPARVFLWKDEFETEHIKSYRRLSNEELAKSRADWIDRMNELIAAPDASYTAELMAAQGGGENWREVLQECINEGAADRPFKPEQFYAYVPNWSAPKDTNTPADVTFNPMIGQDEWAIVIDGFEAVVKASSSRKSSQVASQKYCRDAPLFAGATPDRFAQRHMQDGFDKATREKAGERDFESKVGNVNMSDERCIELAKKEALTIADWIEITGISRGKHGTYLVKRKSVSFIKWEKSLISGWPSSDQAAMERENETAPLSFPCTPARLIQFIDNLLVEIHAFSVPDAFREALADSARAADSELLVSGNPSEKLQIADAEPQKKAPTRTQLKLLGILEQLEQYAESTNQQFCRQSMPGPLGDNSQHKGSFHWFCAQRDRAFVKAPKTFKKYRAGICAIAKWAPVTDFYFLALRDIAPNIAPILSSTLMREKSSKTV